MLTPTNKRKRCYECKIKRKSDKKTRDKLPDLPSSNDSPAINRFRMYDFSERVKSGATSRTIPKVQSKCRYCGEHIYEEHVYKHDRNCKEKNKNKR